MTTSVTTELHKTTVVVEKQIVSTGTQGPRGAIGGTEGSITAADVGALSITARLAEFDTEQARIDARTNLGVQIIDAGTFN
jgi:hypothetical protein